MTVRIVHITDCYPPRTGGIESQVSDLAAQQQAAGDEVHVFTATPGPQGERGGQVEVRGGVRVHRMGGHIPFDLPINPVAGPRMMRRALARIRPDVVHIHAGMVSPFAYDGARVALATSVPTVITWHCMLDGIVTPLRLGVQTTKWAQIPAALTAVSRAAATRVEQVFGAPVQVLPNGLDMTGWELGPVAAESVGSATGPLRLVSTMRLAPRKRAVPLVQMVAAAVRELNVWGADTQTAVAEMLQLTIIGSGPHLRQVRKEVARQGMTGVVELAGRLDRAQLRDRYAQADVFVAPTELEAFGLAALEARTAGLMVLGRRGTGLAEFVTDGVDGYLFDSDAELTAMIVRLARERQQLQQIAVHNRAERPQFDWPDVLDAARAQYRRAASLRSGT